MIQIKVLYQSMVNVKKYNVEELRNIIGIVPQNPTLFSGTIRENLCWRKPNATDGEIITAFEIKEGCNMFRVITTEQIE